MKWTLSAKVYIGDKATMLVTWGYYVNMPGETEQERFRTSMHAKFPDSGEIHISVNRIKNESEGK